MKDHDMKIIQGYPGYKADKQGNVYSFFEYIRRPNGTIISCRVDYSRPPKKLSVQYKKEADHPQVRPHVIVRLNGKRKKVFVSRLVALAWLPNPSKYPCVCHKNDVSDQNNVENLYWGTHKVNALDRKHNQRNDTTIAELQKEIKRLRKLISAS